MLEKIEKAVKWLYKYEKSSDAERRNEQEEIFAVERVHTHPQHITAHTVSERRGYIFYQSRDIKKKKEGETDECDYTWKKHR